MKKFIALFIVIFVFAPPVSAMAMEMPVTEYGEENQREHNEHDVDEEKKGLTLEEKQYIAKIALIILLILHAEIGLGAGIASMILARMFKDSETTNYLHVDFIRNRGKGKGFPIVLVPFIILSLIVFVASYFLGMALCLPLCIKLKIRPFKIFFSRKISTPKSTQV